MQNLRQNHRSEIGKGFIQPCIIDFALLLQLSYVAWHTAKLEAKVEYTNELLESTKVRRAH